jgi:hypothetical protein
VDELEKSVLFLGDFAVGRLVDRLDGLTDDEHVWEPVANTLAVTPAGPGRFRTHRPLDVDPPPMTTIAWKLWHVANDCLGGFARTAWDLDVLGMPDDEWFSSADESIDGVRRAWAGYREGIVALGSDGLRRLLGPAFGPYANDTQADLAFHVLDEVIHHGAEVGMQRDLYRLRT